MSAVQAWMDPVVLVRGTEYDRDMRCVWELLTYGMHHTVTL